MVQFITLKKYAELSGYSVNAIQMKIKKGIWRKDKHVIKSPDGRLHINVEEVEKWLTSYQEA